LAAVDFALTKEQELIRDTIREYSKKHVGPRAEQTDREARFPREQLEGLAPLGFLGALVPEEFGGTGIDKVSYCLALEELAYGCASTSVTVAVHTSVAVTPIAWFGSEEQKKRYLPPLAKGERIGAFALTEPEAGSDVTGIKTTAVRDGDAWVLNGSKVFITNGSHAGQLIVSAKTSPDAERHDALSLFIVESEDDGFEVGGAEHKMGLRGSDTARLAFNDVRLEADRLIGKEGEGFGMLMRVLNSSRLAIGAQANGITRRCLDEAVAYAKERKQFGVPIGKHQSIAFRLADMATRLDASRLMTLNAARMEDAGRLTPEAASMAKLISSETCVWASNQCVQVHGGNGYIKDYVAERLMRDAKIAEIYEGTSEIQRTIIGRALTKG
jgi:alkylation response protein AidB-like acyl-CoA dehydrogenase